MANSLGTPLIGNEESGSQDRVESRKCIFSRCTPLTNLFTAESCEVLSGPVGAVAVYALFRACGAGTEVAGLDPHKIATMMGALVWLALWWIFEPVPIAITSLLPVGLFPFLGIMDSDEAASHYTNDVVMLLLGTFILALGIERYNLHKRMALKILLITGGKKMDPRLVLLGFCAGPAFVSMWMANTSTAVMMLPMAKGILDNLKPVLPGLPTPPRRAGSSSSVTSGLDEEEVIGYQHSKLDEEQEEEKRQAEAVIHTYSQGVILGVTFSSAVGGLTTLIGCGPNLVMPGMYIERFPGAPEVTFLKWLKFALPLVVPYLILQWLFLCWYYCPPSAVPILAHSLDRQMVEKDYKALGSMTFAEKFIFSEFVILVVLWITRSFGSRPGWSSYFGGLPDDGTVSIVAAIILFLVPNKVKEGEMLMDWKHCKGISWSVLLLLGGGFALSKGIQITGLSNYLGFKMQFMENVPFFLLTPVMSLIINICTEFSSNTATSTLFLPIMAELAVSINIHPLFLMIPATFSSSFAFMLPSGTPANALAQGTGFLSVNDMLFPGFVMHIIGILLLSILTPTLGSYVFDLNVPASSLPWIFPV
ncbi:hypothetical protein R1sor_011467 [Riccia sorocarpa]|uniref:Uncharacterized protein n=1 Tax=Riccia sorocarpa TaxID=122646 RepID=A0ABD3I575_9MARC